MKFPEGLRQQPGTDSLGRNWNSNKGDDFGVFMVPAVLNPGRRNLNIIASGGALSGWDHVSVSLNMNAKTCPTWEEMCYVKDLFWEPDEWVVQYHPARKDYVNDHPGVLHLWKPIKETLPLPSKSMV
jgi:hypothetical protein